MVSRRASSVRSSSARFDSSQSDAISPGHCRRVPTASGYRYPSIRHGNGIRVIPSRRPVASWTSCSPGAGTAGVESMIACGAPWTRLSGATRLSAAPSLSAAMAESIAAGRPGAMIVSAGGGSGFASPGTWANRDEQENRSRTSDAGTAARIAERYRGMPALEARNCVVKPPRRSMCELSSRPDRENGRRLDQGRTPDSGNGCLSGARP